MRPGKYFSFWLVLMALLTPSPAGAQEIKHAVIASPAMPVVVAAGKSHEKCIDLAAGQRLNYAFTADTGLAFNVHYHEQATTVYLDRQYRSRAFESHLTATIDQLYCLMWNNKTKQPATLSYSFAIDGADQSEVGQTAGAAEAEE